MALKLQLRDFNLTEAAHRLGISRHALIRELEAAGAVYHDNQFGIRPHQDVINRGLLRVESKLTYIDGRIPKHYHFTTMTIRGLAWIADLIEKKALPKAS